MEKYFRQMAAVSKQSRSINLLNFTEPKFRQSPYILTSPRSLKACRNLGIKPLELLPKSLREYARNTQLPSSKVRRLWKEEEAQRCEKLMLAQCEREKLITSCPRPEAPVCETKKHGKVELSTRIRGPLSPYSKRHGPSSHSKRHGPPSHSKRQRSHSAPHLKEDERMLRALISKVKDKEAWERCQSASHDVWLREKVARETNKEKKALTHQKQVALQQHLDRLQLEESRRDQVTREKIHRHQQELKYNASWQRWEEEARRQEELKADHIAAQKVEREKKRLRQKWRRSLISEVRSEEHQQLQDHITQSMERASASRRDSRRLADIHRKVKSATEQAMAAAKRSEIESKRRAECQILERALKLKEDKASERYAIHKKLKEAELKHKLNQVHHVQQVKANLSKLQQTEELWKEAIIEENKQRMDKAWDISALNNELKAQKAHEMRETKKQDQLVNWAHLRELEKQQIQQVKEDLAMKSKRSEELSEGKQQLIQRSRHHAETTTRLRSQLIERLSDRTFDKKAKEAELRAALENRTAGPRPSPRIVIA